MHRTLSTLASVLLIGLIGGCSGAVESCQEFDPPPNHKPDTCPPKPVADKSGVAKPARYCYRSLAQVDCYSEPQPGRTGYLGSTETSSPPAAAPAATPAPAAATTAPAATPAPAMAPSQPVKLAPAS